MIIIVDITGVLWHVNMYSSKCFPLLNVLFRFILASVSKIVPDTLKFNSMQFQLDFKLVYKKDAPKENWSHYNILIYDLAFCENLSLIV